MTQDKDTLRDIYCDSSPQEVEQAAIEGGYFALYECIQTGKKEGFSWEQTMQGAAIVLARNEKHLLDKLLDRRLKSTEPFADTLQKGDRYENHRDRGQQASHRADH